LPDTVVINNNPALEEGETRPVGQTGYGPQTAGTEVVLTPGTRPGFNFDGWTAPTGWVVDVDFELVGDNFVILSMPPNATVTVVANWVTDTQPQVHLITVNHNLDPAPATHILGGTGFVTPSSGTAGQPITFNPGSHEYYHPPLVTFDPDVTGLTVVDGVRSFTMPTGPLTINVTWTREDEPQPHTITIINLPTGTTPVGQSTNPANYAPEGTEVTITPGTVDGYSVASIQVVATAGVEDPEVEDNVFDMPDSPVVITITWVADEADEFAITFVNTGLPAGENPTNQSTTPASPVEAGETVTVNPGTVEGFTPHVTVTATAAGLPNPPFNATDSTFTMPASAVVIYVLWVDDDADEFDIDFYNTGLAEGVTPDGQTTTPVSPVAAGVPVTVNPGTVEGFTPHVTITATAAGVQNPAFNPASSIFFMPASAVVINVTWVDDDADEFDIDFYNTGLAEGVTPDGQTTTPASPVAATLPVTVNPGTVEGFTPSVTITAVDDDVEDPVFNTANSSFVMPASDVVINVTWTADAPPPVFTITFENEGLPIGVTPAGQATTPVSPVVADVTVTVNPGTVTGFTPSVRVIAPAAGVEDPEFDAADSTFVMPASNVLIHVYWTADTDPTYAITFYNTGLPTGVTPIGQATTPASPVAADVTVTVTPGTVTGFTPSFTVTAADAANPTLTGSTFTMPASAVVINVTWTAAPTYTISFQNPGLPPSVPVPTQSTTPESPVVADTPLTINPGEAPGFEIISVSVAYGTNNVPVNYTEGVRTFVMPASNVTVTVTWRQLASPIDLDNQGLPAGTAITGQSTVPSLAAWGGVLVTVNPGTVEGYLSSVVVRAGEAILPTVSNADGTVTFTMPMGPVVVTVIWVEIPGFGVFVQNWPPIGIVNANETAPAGTQVTTGYTQGVEVVIPQPTRPGWTFNGWDTWELTNQGIQVTNVNNELRFTVPVSSSITSIWIQAIWTLPYQGVLQIFNNPGFQDAPAYRVTGQLPASNFTGQVRSTMQEIGSTVELYPGQRPGFEFVAWRTNRQNITPPDELGALPFNNLPGGRWEQVTITDRNTSIYFHEGTWVEALWRNDFRVTLNNTPAAGAAVTAGTQGFQAVNQETVTPAANLFPGAGAAMRFVPGTRPDHTFLGWVWNGPGTQPANWTVTEGVLTFTMPAHDITITANWQPVIHTYAITFNNTGLATGVTPAGQATTPASPVEAGEVVTVNPGTVTGFTPSVTVTAAAEGVTNPTVTGLTFTMPASAVVINVTWTATVTPPVTVPPPALPQMPPPPTFVPDNTDMGGGGGAPPPVNIITGPPAATGATGATAAGTDDDVDDDGAPDAPTSVSVGTVYVPTAITAGVVTVTLTAANVATLIEEADDGVISFNLSNHTAAESITIPNAAIDSFADAEVGIEVVLPHAIVLLDSDILVNISENFGGANTTINVNPLSVADLNPAQTAAAPAGAVINRITITSGNQNVTNLGGYMHTSVGFAGALPAAAWRLLANGTLELLQSEWSPADSTLTFQKDTLSVFVVATNVPPAVDPTAPEAGFVVTPPVVTPPPAFTGPLMRLTIGSLAYTHQGVPTTGDAAPFIDPTNDRTMIPLRIVAEALGAQVEWLGDVDTVQIDHGGTQLFLVIGEELPGGLGAAQIVDSRTFVPARYVLEVLGASVEWDAAARAVYIYN
jgi:uncharacterized repeat protein (TIGR02543 family)